MHSMYYYQEREQDLDATRQENTDLNSKNDQLSSSNEQLGRFNECLQKILELLKQKKKNSNTVSQKLQEAKEIFSSLKIQNVQQVQQIQQKIYNIEQYIDKNR